MDEDNWWYDHLERDCDEIYEPEPGDYDDVEPVELDNCEVDVYDEPYEDSAWADADALASAGYGTDEDYGYNGGDDEW